MVMFEGWVECFNTNHLILRYLCIDGETLTHTCTHLVCAHMQAHASLIILPHKKIMTHWACYVPISVPPLLSYYSLSISIFVSPLFTAVD